MCDVAGAFNRATQPIVSATQRALTMPDGSPTPAATDTAALTAALTAQTDALNDQTDVAKTSAAAALAAQQAAADAAKTASTPALDSESYRRAADQAMNRLLATTTGVVQGTKLLGDPPVGYRVLTGA